MALTFDDALTALIARLNAAGLNQARSPVGVKNESAPRIDRSFSVLPLGVGLTQRGRERHRAAYRFRVELCHALRPSDGLEAPDQALKDCIGSQKHSRWCHIVNDRRRDRFWPNVVQLHRRRCVFGRVV